MKKIYFICIMTFILLLSNLLTVSSFTYEQKSRVAQNLYDTGAKLMIEEKYTEAKDFFIYCESESMKCNNTKLALKANQMIKTCNQILNLANINEKAPRNQLLPVEKLNLMSEDKLLVNPNLGGLIVKEYRPLGYNWTWRIQLSSDEYFNTTQMSRLKTYEDVSNYINHDNLTKTIAKDILKEAERLKLDYVETINFTLACVQSLPYVEDVLSSGQEEYYRYPIETIVEQGDCEDSSILAAGILKAMGYDVVLVDYPGHVGVGILVDNEYVPSKYYPDNPNFIYHSGYVFQGKKYCYIETTAERWKLGMIPIKYSTSNPIIVPI